MKFALDLLDAVAMDAPEAVLPMIKEAALAGEHIVVQRAFEDELAGKAPGADDPDFAHALLQMTSVAATKEPKKVAEVGGTFRQWAQDAFAGDKERLSRLAAQCFQLYPQRHDHAAKELLALGADPLQVIEPAEREMAGVKLGLKERNASLTANAIYAQSELVGDLVAKGSTLRDPLPVVAEVEVGSQYYPVNAAGYALVAGDLKALKEVLASARGDERNIAAALGETLAFAMDSGLSRDCTREVHHGMAMLIARGADLDADRVAKRLMSHKVCLSADVSGQTVSAEYNVSAMFIGTPEANDGLKAITRLVKDYGMPLDEPVSDLNNGARLLHYAAASNRDLVIKGLLALGANPEVTDAAGQTPQVWAKLMHRDRALAAFSSGQEEVKSQAPSLEPLDIEPMLEDVETSPAAIDAGPPAWMDEAPVDFDDVAVPDVAQSDVSVPAPSADVKPEAVMSRDAIAPSVSEAAASRGAALFARLKSSQQRVMAQIETDPSVDVVGKLRNPPANEADEPARRGFGTRR